MKAVRELGSERRETVRSLSAVGAMGGCGGLALVREDRAGRTAGGPVVGQPAALGSHVRWGEPLKASKRESLPKTSLPRSRDREPPGRRPGQEAAGGRRVTDRSRAVLRGKGGFSLDPYTGSDGSVPSRERKAKGTSGYEGETASDSVKRMIVCANARGMYELHPWKWTDRVPVGAMGSRRCPWPRARWPHPVPSRTRS
jgi:hypothetical protein